MFTTAALLACLVSASDPPAKSPAAPPAAPLRVEAGRGVRIALPPLGPAGAANNRRQELVFAFYIGLFGR
jgi:hypothetical protein